MLVLKNISKIIKIHPFFYLLLLISCLMGDFKYVIYFTILLFIHEIGHCLGAYIFNWKIDSIIIYPFGGCSNFTNEISDNLIKEIIVLIMGPLFQIIFVYIMYHFKVNDFDIINKFSNLILFFNFLPIYPLDGGKLIYLLLSYFVSYYNILKYSIYISFIITFNLILVVSLYFFNPLIIIVFLLLLINIIKENNRCIYYFKKYILERYLNVYNYKLIKINSIYKMRRNNNHLINNIKENKYIEKNIYFM